MAAALVYRQPAGGAAALVAIAAETRGIAASEPVSGALRRGEVIGTRLAPLIFAIADAIWQQDWRFLRS